MVMVVGECVLRCTALAQQQANPAASSRRHSNRADDAGGRCHDKWLSSLCVFGARPDIILVCSSMLLTMKDHSSRKRLQRQEADRRERVRKVGGRSRSSRKSGRARLGCVLRKRESSSCGQAISVRYGISALFEIEGFAACQRSA